MKNYKTKKIIMVVITFMFLIIYPVFNCNVFGDDQTLDNATSLGSGVLDGSNSVINDLASRVGNGTNGDNQFDEFNGVVSNVWGVILVALQVASIAGVIFAGVRYMFASADSKAEIKKGLIHLTIGMVIVFAASSVVGFILRAFKDVASPLL